MQYRCAHFVVVKNLDSQLGYLTDCVAEFLSRKIGPPSGHPNRHPTDLKTLRELYLEHWRIPPDQFEQDLLLRVLYPHARWLWHLMPAAPRRFYFDLDLVFVRSIGQLRSRRDFRNECSEFMRGPSNRKFARKALRLRVSGHRTRQIVDDLFGASETVPPLPPASRL